MAVHPYGTSDPIGNARTEAFRNSVIKTGSTPYIIGSINANYINQQFNSRLLLRLPSVYRKTAVCLP